MTSPKKRRWWQFSLRTLVGLVTVACVVAALGRVPRGEWGEIAGLAWGLSWWALFCYVVVRAFRRRPAARS